MTSTHPTDRLLDDPADELYAELLGAPSRQVFEATTTAQFPLGYIDLATRIIDRTDLISRLEKWEQEDRRGKHPGGRPALIGHRAALIIMLMHVLEGSSGTYKTMAATLSTRLDAERADRIGIPYGPNEHWYMRLYDAIDRITRVLEPYYFPTRAEKRQGAPDVSRGRIMSGEAFRALLEWRSDARQKQRQRRIDWFCNELVDSSVRLAGRHLEPWKGNTAIDATFVPVTGKAGKSRTGRGAKTRYAIHSTNVDAGWYFRAGRDSDHAGESGHGGKKAKSEYGYELEVITMVPNRPGDAEDQLPLLIRAIGLHRPGRLAEHPANMYQALHSRGCPAGLVLADRAYNNLDVERFAQPLTAHGHDFVLDYRSDQLGVQAHFEDFILVEGQWYLNFMPTALVNAVKDRYPSKSNPYPISQEESDRLVAARVAFQLKPKEGRDADGYQRFALPSPDGYIATNAEGEVIDGPTRKSVTIPATAGLKYRQKFTFQSRQWRQFYGMRSIIEHQNALLKDGRQEDIANPYKRSARGYAAQYLALALQVVSANFRKLKTWLDTRFAPRDAQSSTATKRAARRPSLKKIRGTAKGIDGRSLKMPLRT